MAFNPFFFNDSPLPMELIYKAIQELGVLAPTVEELKAKVDKLIADLDEGIKEEVQRVINEMYKNGEFQEILENLAADYFENVAAPKEFKIDARREFRVCLNAQSYNTTTFDEELYSYCQGGKLFKRSGVLYYIGCYVVSNSANIHYYNDNADLRLYAFLDNKWTLIRHAVKSVGHADSICYNPVDDRFYIAWSQKFDGGSAPVGTKTVSILDFDFTNQADCTNNAIFSGEDRISGIDYYDGYIYLMKGSGQSGRQIKIERFEANKSLTGDPEIVGTYILPFANNSKYYLLGSGFTCDDNFFFIGTTTPCGVVRINRVTNKADCYYELGEYANNHMYPTGELENLSCIDNVLYIGTSIHSNSAVFYQYDFNQIFSFDYVNGLSIPDNTILKYGTNYRNISVGDEQNDISVRTEYREISNPNGLTGEYGSPFPTMSEALMFAFSQNQYNDIQILPITKNIVEYLIINGNGVKIRIDGSSFYSAHSSAAEVRDKYAHIGGLFITGASVYINQMLIENRTPEGVISSGYTNNQISALASEITINSCYFNFVSRENSYIYYFNGCFANVGSTYTNSSEVEAVDFTATNSQAYCSTINTHGHWGGGSNTNYIS